MRFFALLMGLLVSGMALASPVQVGGARISELPDGSQLVFELSDNVKYGSFFLANPPRLVVDLTNARMRGDREDLGLRSEDVRAVRAGVRDGANLRIVVDLAAPMRPSLRVAPVGKHGRGLIVDLYRSGPLPVPANSPDPPATVAAVTPAPRRSVAAPTRARNIVIAIDPGHGGKDSGAIGPRGTREKTVVMEIARRLKKLVDKEPGMRAVLTRKDDRYLRLYERIEIARKHKADLFISLHADAFTEADARGSSVFILSTKGASSAAARWLADKENAADFIGGGNFARIDDKLKPVVLDIVHDAVLADSMRLGEKVLGRLNQVGVLHRGYVERAGFAVLKAPDIPSILVETAFISNPFEESKLRSPAHQQQIAQAVMQGIRAHFKNRPSQGVDAVVAEAPPPGAPAPAPVKPPSGPRTHVLRSGETLADIAQLYGIDLSSLLSANGLPSKQLRVPAGTLLTIPAKDS